MAAACAEAGDFDSAVKWQKKAIDLLPTENRSQQLPQQEARLRFYEAGIPYHQQRLFPLQLVAQWTFEGTNEEGVNDSSGNNLVGRCVGDSEVISDEQRGQVLDMGGDGDWINCGNSCYFDISEATLARCTSAKTVMMKPNR